MADQPVQPVLSFTLPNRSGWSLYLWEPSQSDLDIQGNKKKSTERLVFCWVSDGRRKEEKKLVVFPPMLLVQINKKPRNEVAFEICPVWSFPSSEEAQASDRDPHYKQRRAPTDYKYTHKL